MAGMSKEAHAAKRAAKLKAVEAAKPEGERLLQKEWDDHVAKIVSVRKMHDMKLIKHQVITTFCLDEVQVCRTQEEAEKYFIQDGLPWTVSVLKRFLEAYVLSSEGQIQTELSIYGVENKLFSIFSAAKSHGNPVEKDVKRNILLWLHTNLKQRGLVHDNRMAKPTPIPSDITALLRNFFQVEYLVASLHTTRAGVNVALALGLMLDCNSRISELVDAQEVPVELRTAHLEENQEKIFTWRRVELFAFRNETGQGKVQIQARLTFRKLKKKVTVKGTRMKTIPLRLLPLDFAAEDTLRWLIVLGLMDGVFHGISKWADLDSVPYSRDGIKISIKEEFLDIPVLRYSSWSLKKDDTGLVRMTATQFRRELAMLSRYCGLEFKMLPGCLRRTSAYVLAMHASSEERCARMGHSDADKTYFKAYRNTTSTIDFQAMRLGVPAEAVENMSSITLNRLQKPPTAISAAGRLAVSQDPELVANLQMQCDLTDQIVTKYGHFDAVHPSDSHLVSELTRLKSRYTAQAAYLTKKRFNDEWKAHFEQRNEQFIPQEVPDHSINQVSNIDMLVHMSEQQDEQLQQDMQDIDPALLEELSADGKDNHLLEDLGGISLDDVEYKPADDEDVDVSKTVADHKSKKNKYRFSLRPIGRHSLFHGVTDLLYNQAPDLTDAALSDALVDIFNHEHIADRFYPNQEPLYTTMECRFCGEPLTREGDSAKHAYHCEIAALERLAFEKIQEDQANTTLVQICREERCDRPGSNCSYDFMPANGMKIKAGARFGNHARAHHLDRTTSKYVCKAHSLTFSELSDYRLHMIQGHNAPLAIISGSEQCHRGSLVFWCKICEVHIPRTESTEDSHFASHLLEVNEVMQPFGLAGFDYSHQWLHPAFCPFCLFDQHVPLGTRMFFYQTRPRFMTHVKSHLDAIKDGVYCACPAAVESGDGIRPICNHSTPMSKDALKEHLVHDHGMIFTFTETCKKQRGVQNVVAAEDEHEAEETDSRPRKKAKTSKVTTKAPRQPLRGKDVNQK